MLLPSDPDSSAQLSLPELWAVSLRLRPLLWLAPCVVAGGTVGIQLAVTQAFTSSPVPTPLLFVFALVTATFFFLSLSWRARKPVAARFAVGGFCFLAMSIHAALRVFPSPDDISRLATSPPDRGSPLRAKALSIRGFVAGHPQHGEFSTQFPLQCIERDDNGQRVPARGRVWVTAPPDLKAEVGDALQVQGELRPLPRATNTGQRHEHWRYVLESCWSVLRVDNSTSIKPLRAVPRFVFERHVMNARRMILTHYEKAFLARSTPYPRANAQLLTAMTFGEGGLITPLPRRVRDDFRVAGLSHVLVASGTQIAFFGALLLGLGKLLGLRGFWLLALVVPTLLLYAAIAGGAPSITRATIVGVLVVLAVLAGRDVDTLSLWSLALISLAVFDPAQLMSLSLQLSFAATWGMIALAPLAQSKFQKAFGHNFLTELAAFSLAAQLGVLPILLYHFGRVSLSGIGANLVGVPLAGVLVATGIAGIALPLAWLNEFLTTSIAGLTGFFASLPGAQIEAPPVRLLSALGAYAILILAIFSFSISRDAATTGPSGMQLKRAGVFQSDMPAALGVEILRWWRRKSTQLPRPQSVLVVIVFIATCLAAFQHYTGQKQSLRLAMLDVGQGESVVVISPENRVVLIDGGGDAQGMRANVGQSVIVPYLQAMGVRRIDALVLTHADADHCNGLLSVLREVPVGMVLDGTQGNDVTATDYLDLKRAIIRRKIPLVPARAGQKLRLGSASLQIIAPLPPLLGGDNNNSAVLRLEYGRTSALLTGDIETEAEARLLRRGANLKCTILKVAHHGSQTSTTAALLKAARPQAAIISCGRYNAFGHPSSAVLERLGKNNVASFRTDIDGAIEIISDGQKCWIHTTR